MATPASVPATEPAAEAAAPTGKSPLLAKVNVLLFLMIVIVSECLLAYFYLPSSAESAAIAGTPAAKPAAPVEEHATEEKGESEGHSQVEVDLGEFSVTAFQPVSNSTLRIDFHLYGIIGAEVEKDFAQLLEENKHRFRDQVLVIVRSAEITDLTDAGLGLIKRKIQEKSNRLFGKTLLRSVIVSDFSFVEQ